MRYIGFTYFIVIANAFGGIFLDRSFSVNGTNLVFSFEDEQVSLSNKCRIADDIILARSAWTNGIVRFMPHNGYDGYIYDGNVTCSPYAYENIKFPSDIALVGTNICLVVARAVSDAYTNAFMFADARSDIVTSAREFISLISSDRLPSIPSNQVCTLVLYPNVPLDEYPKMRDAIVDGLRSQYYAQPSILAFHLLPPERKGVPHATWWMRIPTISHPSHSNTDCIGYFDAVWYEGMWRMYPSEW